MLITLDRLKRAQDVPASDTSHDVRFTEAIESASQFVINYTDRDFGTAGVTEDRTFKYNGSGILEIDDTSDVNTVAWPGGSPIPASTWYAMPHRGPIYTWLELPIRALAGSREMGFEWNADTILSSATPLIDVTVNATWGFPVVPADVQQAVEWIASGMATSSNRPEGTLTSESIAEIARAYASEPGGESNAVLDGKVMNILDLYKRWSI